ncbi:oxidoreductase-like domain-containing protein [Neptunomonas sp.]|uniref:oxidoreductase-like domain-containing protein n=1 Tax=Neptunomonas TaxID=75687 RepID=UPI003515F87C
MNQKPTPPGEYDCCESACEPCVWDVYYEELRAWNEAEKQRKLAEAVKDEEPSDSPLR